MAYINRLELVCGIEIRNFDTLVGALDKRHTFFHDMDVDYLIMVLTVFTIPYLRHRKLTAFLRNCLKERSSHLRKLKNTKRQLCLSSAD